MNIRQQEDYKNNSDAVPPFKCYANTIEDLERILTFLDSYKYNTRHISDTIPVLKVTIPTDHSIEQRIIIVNKCGFVQMCANRCDICTGLECGGKDYKEIKL